MAAPRRSIIRPHIPDTSSTDNHDKIQKLRTRLQLDRQDFARWMSKLKRAFHVVEKTESRINRVERLIAKLQGE